VYNDDNDDVRDPHSTTVKESRVWIWFTVSDADIHVATVFCNQTTSKYVSTSMCYKLPSVLLCSYYEATATIPHEN